MSAVIDTNTLIYDTFSDTSLHEEAKTGLDQLETWIIPSLVFHEYMWFMKAEDIPLETAKEKTLDYLNNEKTHLIPDAREQIIHALNITKSYKDYNDNIILATAKKLQIPILTNDKNLKNRSEDLKSEPCRNR